MTTYKEVASILTPYVLHSILDRLVHDVLGDVDRSLAQLLGLGAGLAIPLHHDREGNIRIPVLLQQGTVWA